MFRFLFSAGLLALLSLSSCSLTLTRHGGATVREARVNWPRHPRHVRDDAHRQAAVWHRLHRHRPALRPDRYVPAAETAGRPAQSGPNGAPYPVPGLTQPATYPLLRPVVAPQPEPAPVRRRLRAEPPPAGRVEALNRLSPLISIPIFTREHVPTRRIN